MDFRSVYILTDYQQLKNTGQHETYLTKAGWAWHATINILYNLESKTPVLLSKQGFGMGSYFQRGLTLEQPNDRVLHTLRKKNSVLEYIHSHRVATKPWIMEIAANVNDFNGVLHSKVKVLHRAWGLTFEGVLLKRGVLLSRLYSIFLWVYLKSQNGSFLSVCVPWR